MSILRRSLSGLAATAIAIGTLGLSSPVHAADMLADEPTQLVEYGTGWYLRGDLGLTKGGIFNDTETSTPIPGTTNQAVRDFSYNSLVSFGASVGYRVTPNIRGELGVEYLSSGTSTRYATTEPTRAPCFNTTRLELIDTNGDGVPETQVEGVGAPGNEYTIDNCTEADESSHDLFAGTASVFYDLDMNLGGLRPFVGVGGGLVRNQYISTFGNITCAANENERCNPTDGTVVEMGESYTQEGTRNNGTSYHALMSLSVGAAYQLSQNATLDLSYRYAHMFAEPLWGGSEAISAAEIPTDFHTVKLGLRFDFW